MPWCPTCREEFVEELSACPQCGGALLEALPDQGDAVVHDPPVKLTTVYSEQDAALREALLRAEGVPVTKLYRGAGSYLKAYMGNPITPVDLLVPQSYEEQARALLDQLAPEEPSTEIPEEELQSETGYRNLRRIAGILLLALFCGGLLLAVVSLAVSLLRRWLW